MWETIPLPPTKSTHKTNFFQKFFKFFYRTFTAKELIYVIRSAYEKNMVFFGAAYFFTPLGFFCGESLILQQLLQKPEKNPEETAKDYQ